MEGCVLAGKEGLSRREERFCRLYANYRDPERAGTEAGLPPERCRRLLEDARALRKIEEQMEIRRRQAAQQSLAQGLEDLRFSRRRIWEGCFGWFSRPEREMPRHASPWLTSAR